MGAPSKRARKTRSAGEFDVSRLRNELMVPKVAPGAFSWSLAEIVAARNDQMRGLFHRPARLAEAMRTDDAIHVARSGRLAPQRCLPVELQPAPGARGLSIANEAESLFGQRGIAISPETRRDIHDALVVHSNAFALATPVPRPDGTRVDYTVKHWPIEFVRWNAVERTFKTRVDGLPDEAITHGDGRWIVFQEGEYEPFKNGALLAAAMIWAARGFALRDWTKGSVSHGSSKIVGALPAGVPLQDADGNPTPEALALVALMRDMMSGDSPVGLKPAGSEVAFLANVAAMWQIFPELVEDRTKAAARLFLGTDGILGAAGGAPGVDIGALFGVATTKVQGDVDAIERGFQSGLIEPWTAINFGDSSLAPYRKYCMPDADANALQKSLADRTAAFSAALKGRKDAGIELTQEDVDGLATDFNVRSFKIGAVVSQSDSATSAAAE